MRCSPALDEVHEELGRVCLRWSTTDEKNRSAVAREEMSSRTYLNMGEWFEAEPISAFLDVVHVANC